MFNNFYINIYKFQITISVCRIQTHNTHLTKCITDRPTRTTRASNSSTISVLKIVQDHILPLFSFQRPFFLLQNSVITLLDIIMTDKHECVLYFKQLLNTKLAITNRILIYLLKFLKNRNSITLNFLTNSNLCWSFAGCECFLPLAIKDKVNNRFKTHEGHKTRSYRYFRKFFKTRGKCFPLKIDGWK